MFLVTVTSFAKVPCRLGRITIPAANAALATKAGLKALGIPSSASVTVTTIAVATPGLAI